MTSTAPTTYETLRGPRATEAQVRHCKDVLLVGLGEHALPTAPRISFDGTPPFMGCNNLVCLMCRSIVKHADACSTTRAGVPTKEDLEELYASNDPANSPLLDRRPVCARSRTYFCRCTWVAVELGGFKRVRALDDNDWECGGHGESDA